MCGQLRFDVRNNVATFVGYTEECCLPMLGIAPFGDKIPPLRAYVTDLLRAFLRDRRYETGEGRVTVTCPDRRFGRYHVSATIFAQGPDADLYLPSYLWSAVTRSAGS